MAKNQVIVSITANAKGLNKALGDSTSGLSKFGKIATAVGAAAGVAMIAIGTKAIKSASQLEQNMGAMESVFKSNSKQMEQWANTAASSLGLAKSEYAGLATVLGSQLKNMGVAQDQLGKQTNSLIGLGADLAAQFGGSTSDAVSALSSLLRGERDPIERYGVSINEAAVKAKMAEMGLSGLSGEAEKNAKLQATLALLTQQTADAQGAFARESTTLAGAQQRLAAGTENLYATLGTALLPAATAVTAALGSMVNTIQESDAFQALTGNLTAASNAFADFIFNILNGTSTINFGSIMQGLLPAIESGIQNAASWLAGGGLQPILASIASGRDSMLQVALTLFKAIGEALPQILPALVDGLLTFVMDIVNLLVSSAPMILQAGVQVFTGLIQSLAVVLPQLIAALLAMLPGLIESLLSMVPMILDAATQLFTALVEAIPVIIPPLITAIIELLPKLVESILGMLPGILDAAINLFTALVESLPIILPLLLNAILDLLPKLVTTIISMIPRLIDAAVKLFTGLVQALPKVIPQLIQALIGLAPKMVSTLIGLVPQLISAGVNLIGGLVKGLFQAAGSVGNALLNIAKNAIGGFLSFLGIKSPSRLMMGFGKNTVQGLAQGISKNFRLVDGAMDGLSARVSDGFSGTLSASEVRLAGDNHMAARRRVPVAPVYNVNVSTLNANAETGRVIVESIRDYESAGGRM